MDKVPFFAISTGKLIFEPPLPTGFHSKTSVKMWQINQKLLNFNFTNAINQKIIKTKFVNNYRAYDKMKNKIITMQRNSLYIFIKEWAGDSLMKN